MGEPEVQPQVPDPPRPWEAVVRDLAGLEKFSPASTDPGFDPAQRLDWVQRFSGVRTHIDPAFVAVLFRIMADQISALLHDGAIIIGVQKKGMSLLHEIEAQRHLGKHRLVSDDHLKVDAVVGRRVIVVDDSVHTGQTFIDLANRLKAAGAAEISLVTVLASEKGSDAIRLAHPEVKVSRIVRVAEEQFSAYFQIYIVPLLDACSAGAIPNRPARSLEVTAPNYDPIVWGKDILRSLAQMPFVSALNEIPPLDGALGGVFHGTLELNESMLSTLEAELGGGIIEQSKLRVFVLLSRPSHVHLCAIVYFQLPGRFSVEDRDRLEGRLADRLISEVTRSLRTMLVAKGYSVEEKK